jgi:hypothetical protein
MTSVCTLVYRVVGGPPNAALICVIRVLRQ